MRPLPEQGSSFMASPDQAQSSKVLSPKRLELFIEALKFSDDQNRIENKLRCGKRMSVNKIYATITPRLRHFKTSLGPFFTTLTRTWLG